MTPRQKTAAGLHALAVLIDELLERCAAMETRLLQLELLHAPHIAEEKARRWQENARLQRTTRENMETAEIIGEAIRRAAPA